MDRRWHISLPAVVMLLLGTSVSEADVVGVSRSFCNGKVIDNKTGKEIVESFSFPDTLSLENPSGRGFELKIWVDNLHNVKGKKYKYCDGDGKKHSVESPEWGIRADNGLAVMFSPESEEDALGGIRRYVCASVYMNGRQISSGELNHDNGDWNGTALYSLSGDDGAWTLALGEGGRHKEISFNMGTGQPVGSVSLVVTPGGAVRVAALTAFQRIPVDVPIENPASLKDKNTNSYTSLAGEWEMYDYNIDNALLAIAPLRLIICPEDDNKFRIYYVSGYEESLGWKTGMCKGVLHTTPFPDTYDVEWTDAAFRIMDKGIKASYSGNGILKIHFPAQDSHIRFRRLDWNQ